MKPDLNASDNELVVAVRSGDARNFDTLVERHFRIVYLIAYSRLRSAESAEDLAQEVFLRAFLHIGNLSDPAQFGAWVSRVARNLAIDWLRRGQRGSRLLPMVPLDAVEHEIAEPGAKGVRDTMATEQESAALRKAILDLPAEQREVILLQFSEDLSQREIAERLGVHQATVSRHLSRALKALRGALEPALRREAIALQPAPRALMRASLLVAAVGGMSQTAKAALVTASPIASWSGSGGVAAEAAGAAAGLAGVWQTLIASLVTGGKIMATGKGFAATAAVAALIGGGVYVANTGSQGTLPGSIVNLDTYEPTPGGTEIPTIEIIDPTQGPEGEATPVPRLESEQALEEVISTLGDRLAQSRFLSVPSNATLFVHGSGADLRRFQFSDWSLSAAQEPQRLTPEFRQVSDIGGPWTVTFDRPLSGHIILTVYRMPQGGAEFTWLASVEGAPPPNPDVVAQLERDARWEVSRRQETRTGSWPPDLDHVYISMRSLATAIEAYRVDWNAYPPSVWSGDPRNINEGDTLPGRMPGFLGAALTTPIAYVPSLPADPYSGPDAVTFAYETYPEGDRWQQAFGSWALFSRGPDRDWDFQILGEFEGTRMAPEDTADFAIRNTYDPTNGVTSNGDIVRSRRIVSPMQGSPENVESSASDESTSTDPAVAIPALCRALFEAMRTNNWAAAAPLFMPASGYTELAAHMHEDPPPPEAHANLVAEREQRFAAATAVVQAARSAEYLNAGESDWQTTPRATWIVQNVLIHVELDGQERIIDLTPCVLAGGRWYFFNVPRMR